MDEQKMNTLQAISLGFSPLHPHLAYSGYAIFIHEQALSFLNERIQDNYSSLKLIKKIIAMRSNPRPWDGGIKVGSTDHRQLAIDGIWINYFIDSGIVYIDSIFHNINHNKNTELAGLHHIVKENGGWSIKQTYINEIDTQYAAVNGANNNRDMAINIMPAQLEQAYKGENITEFTLFHNPTQCDFSDKYQSSRIKISQPDSIIERFSQLLHVVQQKQQDLKWVTHKQGCALFMQAVKAHARDIGGSLDKHTVFFQQPNLNVSQTKRDLRHSNIKLHKQGYTLHSLLHSKDKLQKLIKSCVNAIDCEIHSADKKVALSSTPLVKNMIRRVV